MNISTLTSRFEFYAQKHKLIKHVPGDDLTQRAFLQVDIQDITVSISTGLKFPCLFLQTPEVEKDGGIDCIAEHYEGSFVVLMVCENGATAAFKMDLLYQCKQICDQIFNRMIADTDEYFEGARIKTSEGSFGPVQNLIGWGVNFGFEQAYDGELNPEDWEDLD
jgi:hypothetical protein